MRKLLKSQATLFQKCFIGLVNPFFPRLLLVASLILITAFSVKATTYYSKGNLPSNLKTSWSTNQDGTGAQPTNFTTNGDVFIIRSIHTMVTTKRWVIGNGSSNNTVTLQIDGNLNISNTLKIDSYSQIVFNSTAQIIANADGDVEKFTLASDATLKTMNPYGISGSKCSVPSSGAQASVVLNAGANYELNGTTAQATLGLPATVNNLTISNTSGVVTIDNSLTASTLTIKPGAKLTQTAGALSVTTLFDDQSDATSTGSFISTGTGTVTATTVKVKQHLKAGRNWYVSSPVAGATTAALSTASSVQSYNEPTASWVVENGSTLSPMKGYIAVSPTSTGEITFTGTLNTGPKSINLTRTAGKTKEGFNLVGNPYLSFVDWDMANKTNLETTMWYRTKSTGGAYVFDTYGATAGIGTNLNGNGKVTKNIPPMQAFWVQVVQGQSTGTLAFDNSMRSHQDVATNKLRVASVDQPKQKVLRLQVSNGTNSDEAIVLFNPNAVDGFDDYDSPKMTNANPVVPEIYTMAGNETVVINGFSKVNFDTEIPLGFTTGESNTFSIKATEITNFDSGTEVILKDKLLRIEQALTPQTSYTFKSDVYSSTGRFSLLFRTQSVITDVNTGVNDPTILINKNGNNQIIIDCLTDLSPAGSVSVYNAVGRLLVLKPLTGCRSVLDIPQQAGIYLVKVVNAGKTMTKKMIFN